MIQQNNYEIVNRAKYITQNCKHKKVTRNISQVY